jgi:hypothetical protein
MRARLAILIGLAVVVSSVLVVASPVLASREGALAQTEQEGGGEGGESEGTTQQGGTEDEEGESAEEGGGATETGPPWTYQMARIALVLLALTFLGVAFAYWRFVAMRRREGF